ncbi:hypothetical protein RJ640_028320 [Escallonia rubra]|uniref:Nudix hydrolase domain-containing protein n=1 Tax=Escallonia rubra TaxID=112253 RepID=A0AA88QQC0_9ASTE|nr:hypothetical protein RJ640_028320 [Escallonia rubra]
MSPPPQPPPPPPQPPPNTLHRKPTSLPDFFFTAFSLFILLSSSHKHATNLFPPLFSFPIYPRRFLKFPTMSLNPAQNSNRHQFPNPNSLSDWLRPRLPSDSFASWGAKPGTKNVHNLWLEISEGETSLTDSNPPTRTVEVVIVRVLGKNDLVLIESHQELSDGSVRTRSRPLSEKMKPGETVDSAVIRAVKEELGSIVGGCLGNCVRIVPGSYSKKAEERVSVSYPGLPARYVLHTVEAWVDGLPEGEFATDEGEEYGDSDEKRVAAGAVYCKKHYWKWVDSGSV